MATKFIARVYDASGQILVRQFKGQPVPGGELIIERAEADRAWLTARAIPDDPRDWPEGTVIKVTAVPKKILGFLKVPERLVYERKWDGTKWIEVGTGEPVV